MARVRLIHWKAAEAGSVIEALRAGGFDAEYDGEANGPAISRAIRANLPDAVVIDLSRLPSHGREMGIWLRGLKSTRHVPLVFVNGGQETRERVRQDLPDAVCTTTPELPAVLQSACNAPALSSSLPVQVPAQMMDRYKERTAAQKLGIVPSSMAAVISAPRGYAAIIGILPNGAELAEDPPSVHPVTLWFITDYEILLGCLPRMRSIAAETKLWIIWRKGPEGRISQNCIRETAIDAGLVDYKICSLEARWSGILFARKKA